jgi:TolA-binding protein
MYIAFQAEREPETFSEAMSGNDKEMWVDAVTEEFSALRKSVQNEKGQCENKVDKMRQAISELENEKRSLQEELARNESRATKLELQNFIRRGHAAPPDDSAEGLPYLGVAGQVRGARKKSCESWRALFVIEVNYEPTEFNSGTSKHWKSRNKNWNRRFAY